MSHATGVDKSGGDAANVGIQGGDSDATNKQAAVGGLGAVGSIGGDGTAQAAAASAVDQALGQYADGGDGGDDNTHSNTNVNI